jgi:hypothetical protein
MGFSERHKALKRARKRSFMLRNPQGSLRELPTQTPKGLSRVWDI